MSLNIEQLKIDLGTAYDGTQDLTLDAGTSKNNFINAMATAIDNYVKSALIVYTNGLIAPNGAVGGTFNGHLE